MALKELVEQAFGTDAENRIPQYLMEKELPPCSNDAARWLCLFEKCVQWEKEFLLWEEIPYVKGVRGWSLETDICRLRLPKEAAEDWTEYLYRITLLAAVRQMYPSDKNDLVVNGQKSNHFFSPLWFSAFHVTSGFANLTREQWLEEVTDLLHQSKERYQESPGNYLPYQQKAALNYQKFSAALEYLAQNVGDCEVVRMNQHSKAETVWYFAKAQDCFYLMYLRDRL